MKDKHGTFRGKCSCGCIEYKTVIGSQSPKCTTCGHSPVKHVSYGTVSACKKCDCQNFESELGDFDICAYCECPIQDHSTPNEEIPTASPTTSYSHHTVNNETNPATSLHNSTIDTGLKQFQHQPGLHFASTIQPGLHFTSTIQPDIPLNATQQSQFSENNQNYTFPPPLSQFQLNTSPQQLLPAVNHVPNTQYTFEGTGILGNSMQGNDQASNFPAPFVTNSIPQNMMPENQTFNFAGAPFAANIPENSIQGNNQSANFHAPFGSFDAPDNMNIMNPVNQIQQQNQLFNSPQQPQHLFDNCNNQFQAPHQQQQFAGSPPKCSIPECLAPCYVDQYTGQVHACCSLVHEMENQRRKAMGSNLVKGITHCLLPECSKHVWPFMNYCGKTHANVGQSRGLIPPDPATSQPNVPKKQISGGTCALPSCNRPRSNNRPDGLQPGDHIYRLIDDKFGIASKVEEFCNISLPSSLYHHGIYLGNVVFRGKYKEDVVANVAGVASTNPIIIETFEKFARNRLVYIVNYPPRIVKAPYEVISEALKFASGEKKFGIYSIFTNNCEDFASLCKVGMKFSCQIVQLLYAIKSKSTKSGKLFNRFVNKLLLAWFSFWNNVRCWIHGTEMLCMNKIMKMIDNFLASPNFAGDVKLIVDEIYHSIVEKHQKKLAII